MSKSKPAATIGFRCKTGRAIAVALSGTAAQPRLVLRREVSLVHPGVPATAEPYHEVMELPWSDAMLAVRETIAAIEQQAVEVLGELARELQRQGFEVRAVGVVGSPDRPLEKIGNEHIRAHAAEGIAFRRVLEVAAAARSYRCQSFSDRTIVAQSDASIMKSLGREAGPPWRADERAAATAAWILLSQRSRIASTL